MMQQDFAIAAHREGLSIGREPQRSDYGRLMIDRGLVRRGLGRRIVFGAGIDPIANGRDLSLGERRLTKRHRRLEDCRNELDDEALFRRTGHESRSTSATGLEPGVRREIEVRLFRSGLMTAGAVLLENRLDVATECDRLGLWLLCLRRQLHDLYQHRT
jgi:hypothetical protein